MVSQVSRENIPSVDCGTAYSEGIKDCSTDIIIWYVIVNIFEIAWTSSRKFGKNLMAYVFRESISFSCILEVMVIDKE